MKIKSFQFTTGIDPKTELHFSGASGKPLEISFASKETSARFMLDTDSVLRLQAFLADYLQPEDNNNHAPVYAPTGRAIAIMDWDTLDIIRVFKIKNVSGFEQAETESYDSLSNIIRNSIDIELPKQMIFIFFETYDGSINQSLLRRILRACISYQIDYVRTGDLFDKIYMLEESCATGFG